MTEVPVDRLQPVLEVHHVTVRYRGGSVAPAVLDANLEVRPKEIVGVVGQSGSGKSTLGMAVAGLLDPRQCEVSGTMRLGDTTVDLGSTENSVWETLRGSRIGYVFQDAQAALNPLLTIEQLLVQPQRHRGVDLPVARSMARDLLEAVEIPDVDRRLRQYPHELSGGMKQRVVIAAALMGKPSVLIADEPTTALDVTLQAQIIRLLKRLKDDFELSVVFISHDIDLVADIANHIVVMKDGIAVEAGSADSVVRVPSHPYTSELIRSIPRLERIGFFKDREYWSSHD
jgi:ABC-type dipeptide/oligopeptide/nickel transport system ATPase component